MGPRRASNGRGTLARLLWVRKGALEKAKPPDRSKAKWGLQNIRQRPTLPRGFPRSTIGSGGLNFRVRDGNGCDPSDIATGILFKCHTKGRESISAVEELCLKQTFSGLDHRSSKTSNGSLDLDLEPLYRRRPLIGV